MIAPLTKELYTLHEVADLLGFTYRTIYRWRAAGTIDAYKAGGSHWRVRREEVARLLGRTKAHEPALRSEHPWWTQPAHEVLTLPGGASERLVKLYARKMNGVWEYALVSWHFYTPLLHATIRNGQVLEGGA